MPTASTIYIRHVSIPCGKLILGEWNDCLCLCDWTSARHREAIDNRLKRMLHADFIEHQTSVLQQASAELEQYFAGQRLTFDLPLHLAGTDFQIAVWQELKRIPYGETISYSDLAGRLRHHEAVRAVANAVGANPLSVFIPCHRVIGTNHTLTGYAGGLTVKKFLLDLEVDNRNPLKINLFSDN